jgi:hypothetical protein
MLSMGLFMTLSPIVGLCGPSRASLYYAGAARHALRATFEIGRLSGRIRGR